MREVIQSALQHVSEAELAERFRLLAWGASCGLLDREQQVELVAAGARLGQCPRIGGPLANGCSTDD